MSDYDRYLGTLRYIPDDIVLSMAVRDLELGDPQSCICGWALREGMAREALTDAEDQEIRPVRAYTSEYIATQLSERFGGTAEAWRDIYWDACNSDAGEVENAFVTRVLECVA